METNSPTNPFPANDNQVSGGAQQPVSPGFQPQVNQQASQMQPSQTQQVVQTPQPQPIQNANYETQVEPGKAVVTMSANDDSKKSVVLIIIGVFLIIILGVGGFYLYTQFTAPKEADNQQLTTLPAVNKITQTPTAAPTQPQKQLSIYEDENYGYSLTYPSDFEKADYQEGDYKGISLTYLGAGQVRPQSELVDGVVVKTLVIDDAEEDLESYVIAQREKETSDTNEVSDISETMLSDRVGYEYTISGQGEYKVIFVENGGNIIRISTNIQGSQEDMESYQNMADEIIDSITFTQIATTQTPTVATASATPTP